RGGFGEAVTYPCGIAAIAAAIGDVSGDGRPDVVVVGYAGALGVLRGNARGTLDPVRTYATGIARGDDVALADLDEDGRLDAILTDSATGRIVVLRGNARGAFEAP